MIRKGWAMVLFACVVAGAAAPLTALESGPRVAVRQFCRADGLGQRVQVGGWAAIAPLVTWLLEPAWDQVVLIDSYQVGSPYAADDGGVAVEVRYAVIGEVSARGLDIAVHLETADFRMDGADGSWRILGPPLPPHIFASQVDVDAMRESLQFGGQNFLPNTIFIQQVLQSAGRNVAYLPAVDLLHNEAYRVVDKPEVNDLAVYLRDGVPYHVGVFEADDRIASSTLNAGIVRTTPDAFPGEVTYLRVVEPESEVEAMPVTAPTVTAESAQPSPTRTVAVQPRPRPSPTVKRGKGHPRKRHASRAQPSKRKRVKETKGEEKTKRPSPIATRQVP
jgi:hypothetical protein